MHRQANATGSSQYVAVDDLGHTNVAAVADHVEALGLDIGPLHDLPSQIVFLQFGVGRVLGLHADRLNAFGAVMVVRKAYAVAAVSSAASATGLESHMRLFHPGQHLGGYLRVSQGRCVRMMRLVGELRNRLPATVRKHLTLLIYVTRTPYRAARSADTTARTTSIRFCEHVLRAFHCFIILYH